MIAKPRWFHFPPNQDPPLENPPVPDYVPEGPYLLEVEDIADKMSRWGNPYFLVRCKVVDPKVHEDFKVYFVLSTVTQALWAVAKFIEVTVGNDPTGQQFLFRPSDYIGRRFVVDLVVDCFMGRWRNQVKLSTLRSWR